MFSNFIPLFVIVVIVIVLLNKYKKGKDETVKSNIHQQKQATGYANRESKDVDNTVGLILNNTP